MVCTCKIILYQNKSKVILYFYLITNQYDKFIIFYLINDDF